MCVSMSVCVYLCLCVCIYVCVCVSMSVCVWVYVSHNIAGLLRHLSSGAGRRWYVGENCVCVCVCFILMLLACFDITPLKVDSVLELACCVRN